MTTYLGAYPGGNFDIGDSAYDKVGGGSLGDASNASYRERNNGTTAYTGAGRIDSGLTADANLRPPNYVRAIRARMTAWTVPGLNASILFGVLNGYASGATAIIQTTAAPTNTTPTVYTTAWLYSAAGQDLSSCNTQVPVNFRTGGIPIKNMGLYVRDYTVRQPGSTYNWGSPFSELTLDIVTSQPPTISGSLALGSFATSKPTLTWTYAQVDSLPQSRIYIEIAASTDPTYSNVLYRTGLDIASDYNGLSVPSGGSGIAASSGSHFVDSALPNGSYIWRIRVGTPWANGALTYTYDATGIGTWLRDNGTLWSILYSGTFTINTAGAEPKAPKLSLSWVAGREAVLISGQAPLNLLTENQSNGTESGSVGASDWTATSNCTLSSSTAQASQGTRSLALTSTAAAAMSARTPDAGKFPVVAGQTYAAILFARAATTSRVINLNVKWFQEDGTTSAGADLVGSLGGGDSNSAWTPLVVSGAAPAGAAWAQFYVGTDTSAVSEVHYFDRMGLIPWDTATWGSPASTDWSIGGLSNIRVRIRRRTSTADSAATEKVEWVRGASDENPLIPLAENAYRWSFYDQEIDRYVNASPTLYGGSDKVRYEVQLTAYSPTVFSDQVDSAGGYAGNQYDLATPTSNNTWVLKALEDQTLWVAVDPVNEAREWSEEEPLTVVYPLDQPEGLKSPVTITSGVRRPGGSMSLQVLGEASWETLKNVVDHQGLLLLQEPFEKSDSTGVQHWLRVNSRSWSETFMAGKKRRVVELGFVTVDGTVE